MAIINSTNGDFIIKSTGTAKVTATQAGDANYHSTENGYILTIKQGYKQPQTDFVFAQDSITITYEPSTTISNIATGGQSLGAISYTIDNTGVATIDANSGKVTIQGAGVATITASRVGDAYYESVTNSYNLRVNKANQSGFTFAQSVFATVYEKGKTIQPIATGGQSNGAILYTITNPNANVATIDANTGEVTIEGANEGSSLEILATRAGNANYEDISASYLLTINKAEQPNLKFAQDAITINYAENHRTINGVTGGQGTGAITYSIDNTNVATIGASHGVVTIQGVGKATITATKAGDGDYNATKSSYLLTVTKAEQTDFRFKKTIVLLRYPADPTNNKAIGGKGTGKLSYRVLGPAYWTEEIVTINSTNGLLTIHGSGAVEVAATKEGDANYQSKTIIYQLWVFGGYQTGFSFAEPSITLEYKAGATTSNIATGGQSTGTRATTSYKIDKPHVAIVDEDTGEVTIKSAGTATITAIKRGDIKYLSVEDSYLLTVNKRVQTSFKFAQASTTTAYEAGKKINNVVAGGEGTGKTTYSINNTGVGTIDADTGEVTIQGAGTATITASKAGDVNHHPTKASYLLKVNKADQTTFRFIQKMFGVAYEANKKITNGVIRGESTGEISYTIDNPHVATINTTSGEVTLQNLGTATITATHMGDANYNDAVTNYILTVDRKKDQTGFSFEQNAITLVYKADATTSNIATGGEGTGAISYIISSTKVAQVDSNSGLVIIKGAGKATIIAIKAGDADYNPISTTYLLTVSKADQTGFEFTQSSITRVFSPGSTVSNIPKGGQGTGKISYTILGSAEIATIDANTGEVTIKGATEGLYLVITATKEGDANYNPIYASYLLEVKKAEQTGFKFAQDSTTTAYAEYKKIRYLAKGGEGTGAIRYSVVLPILGDSRGTLDAKSVATIDADTGEVELQGVGNVTIIATKMADANYKATNAFYILEVTKGEQTDFGFAQDSITITYEPHATTSNIATGGQSQGAIIYSIDDTSVATIDDVGEVTLQSAGTAIITATKEGDANYNSTENSYVLRVNRREQTNFGFAQSLITLVYEAGATTKNVASGGESIGAISYSIDNTSVATISSTNGEVTIQGAGTATITATKASDAKHKTTMVSYLLTVNKAEQTGFKFAQSSITIAYSAGGTTSNVATGGESLGAITYSIDDTSVATVDNDGEVTIKGIGTAIITATKAGNANYNAAMTNYPLTVNKAEQTGFGFEKTLRIVTYKADDTVLVYNLATGGLGTGAITYSIDKINVATISTDNGFVTIKGAGTATITATKAGDANYKSTENSYVLKVKKAEQTGFRFIKGSTTKTSAIEGGSGDFSLDASGGDNEEGGLILLFTVEYAAGGTASNTAIGGESSGVISYSIDNTSVATINTATGEVTLQGVGTVKITATKDSDANYKATTTEYTLKVKKGEQTGFGFPQSSITLTYEQYGTIDDNLATGGESSGEIIYNIDTTEVAIISPRGEVLIKTAGTATITAIKKGDDNYKSAHDSYFLTVNKAQQTKLSFVQDAITLVYDANGVTTSNIATGGTGTGSISYSIDNTSVATVNTTNGEVTIQGAGTAKITATKAGGTNYNDVKGSYMLMVDKAEQTGFRFTSRSITIDYVANSTIRNIPIGGQGAGAISYTIYFSYGTNVATIDPDSGVVTLNRTGEAQIEATKAGDANYKSTFDSYALNINKGEQTGFRFAQDAITIEYKAGVTTHNIALGGQPAGEISYSIDNTSVATINTTNGEVTIQGAGKATITASKAGDGNYNPVSNSYILTVKKARQADLSFAHNAVTTTYGTGVTINNVATGGSGAGTISYKVVDGKNVAEIKDSSNDLVSIRGAGTAKIMATKAGDANYTTITTSYMLEVKKAEQTGFEFVTPFSLIIDYELGATTSNIAIGGESTGAIMYSINNIDVAMIHSTSGEVTIKRAGAAIVTAIKLGDANYHATATNYILAVDRVKQTDFTFTKNSVSLVYKPDATTSNVAEGGEGTGAISYSIDNTSVATINSTNGELTIKGAGTAIITANKASDVNYEAIAISYVLMVSKAEQTPLSFSQGSITLVYGSIATTSNIATGGEGTGLISYSIDNTSVATVDNNGEVTIKGAGIAKIIATRAGDANYKPVSNSYILTVNKADQTGFRFKESRIIAVFSPNGKVSNIPIGGQSTGKISYTIWGSSKTATIDENTGEVTIKGATGELYLLITATKAGDANYKPTIALYSLRIMRAEQTGFGFVQDALTVGYGEGKKVSNATTGGKSIGKTTYSIDNKSVATVDSSGVVTLKGLGTAKITASKLGDANYKAISSSYVLIVNKGEQTDFRFAQDILNVEYAEDKKISNLPQGDKGTGAITYSIDNTNVATVNTTSGEVTLKSTGTAIVTAEKAGDDNYHPASATYSLRVGKLSITLGIKNMQFVWTATTGTDHYRLESDIGGGFVDASTKGFVVVPNSTNIKQTYVRADIALHRYVPLLNGKGPLYRVEACDAGNTCSDDVMLYGSLSNEELNKLIGYFKTGNILDEFGRSVSVSGDGNTLAVGAPWEDSNSTGVYVAQGDGPSGSGAVHVFVRDSSSAQWTQQAYIKASNTGVYDDFGNAVSLSYDGNTLAVSADGEDSNSTGVNADQHNSSATNSGAVYVFTRSDGSWSQQAYIKASNTDGGDSFGGGSLPFYSYSSVSLGGDGNTLAVGAPKEDSNSTGVNGDQHNSSATNSGAVYVFTRSAGTWSQQAYIKASNTDASDYFGRSVSLSGDGNTLAVGAIYEDSNSTGVNGDQNNNGTNTGAVYVFTRNSNSVWSQQAYIKASNTNTVRGREEFGGSVSLSGDGNTLAVGAQYESGNAKGINGDQDQDGYDARQSGAVYVFVRDISSAQWSQQAYIKASNADGDHYDSYVRGDQFGHSVSLSRDGNTLAVGAIKENGEVRGVRVHGDQDNSGSNPAPGAVYVFTRSSTGIWTEQAYVKSNNTSHSSFGRSVSLSSDGDSLAVGAFGISPLGGAVYLY